MEYGFKRLVYVYMTWATNVLSDFLITKDINRVTGLRKQELEIIFVK